jgi:hypothetical protein
MDRVGKRGLPKKENGERPSPPANSPSTRALAHDRGAGLMLRSCCVRTPQKFSYHQPTDYNGRAPGGLEAGFLVRDRSWPAADTLRATSNDRGVFAEADMYSAEEMTPNTPPETPAYATPPLEAHLQLLLAARPTLPKPYFPCSESISAPARTSWLEPWKSRPTGSHAPPRWRAKNASAMAMYESRFGGLWKPCPSSG